MSTISNGIKLASCACVILLAHPLIAQTQAESSPCDSPQSYPVIVGGLSPEGEPRPYTAGLALEPDIIITPLAAIMYGEIKTVTTCDCETYNVVGIIAEDGPGGVVLLKLESPLDNAAPRDIAQPGDRVTYITTALVEGCGMLNAFANGREVLSRHQWVGYGEYLTVDWNAPSIMWGESVATDIGYLGIVPDRASGDSAWVYEFSRADKLPRHKPRNSKDTLDAIAPIPELRRAGSQAGHMRGNGDLDGAKQAASLALEIDPQNWDALYQLGVIADMQSQPEKAINLLSRAHKIEPAFAQAPYSTGIVYLHTNQPQLALEQFDVAIKSHPRLANAYGMKAISLYKLGQVQQAIPWGEKAIDCEPNTPEHHQNLLLMLDELGRAEHAVRVARILCEDFPNHYKNWTDLASRLSELDRQEESINAIEQGVKHNPNSVELAWFLGQAYRLTDRPQDALQVWQHTLDAYPDDPFAPNIRDAIKALEQDH